MYKKKQKYLIIAGFIIVFFILLILMITLLNSSKNKKVNTNTSDVEIINTTPESKANFDYKIISKANDYYNENYVLSPLGLAYGLKILSEGTEGETKGQIDTILKDYNTGSISNLDNKISISNALFINTSFKGKMNSSYVSRMQTVYNCNVLYDDFTSSNAITSWVTNKSNGQITRISNSIRGNSILNLLNNVALNIDWKQPFDQYRRLQGTFTLADNTKVQVPYITTKNSFGYVENINAEGFIRHYAIYNPKTGDMEKDNNQGRYIELELIAIKPKTNINDYISILDQYELSRLIGTVKTNTSTQDYSLKIPVFNYDFTFDRAAQILNEYNVDKIFNETADLSKMSDEKLYLSNIVQASHISLSENGTKNGNTIILTERPKTEETSTVDPITNETIKSTKEVNFDKPFIYIIKEKNKTNIWFFGVVYEPTTWDEYDKALQKAIKDAEPKRW